jgi:N-acetylglucosaminyldiphosphoundecaprenol N-acetyl-beta-D-mannosaminyltransferase
MADFDTKPTSTTAGPGNDAAVDAYPAGLSPASGHRRSSSAVDRVDGDDVDLRSEPHLIDVIRSLPVLDRLPRVHLFGLDFVSCGSVVEVSRRLLEGAVVADDREPMVLTPNVDIMVHLDQNPNSVEADAFRRAQYCLPDGQPLVWASRLIGRRLEARLPGSGLFADLWPRLVAERRPVVVVAPSQVVADELGGQHPMASFVVPPMFDADDAGAIDSIVNRVIELSHRCRPEFVLIGIGNPKDPRVATRLLGTWPLELGPRPVVMALGASFQLYLGHKTRAPAWVQRIGMEWFHRFLQEPRRLFHRYFIKDMAFLGIVWREFKATRLHSVGLVRSR